MTNESGFYATRQVEKFRFIRILSDRILGSIEDARNKTIPADTLPDVVREEASGAINQVFDYFEATAIQSVYDAAGAERFYRELIASTESFDLLAETHGVRALSDIIYLQAAILNNTYIDVYPDTSKIIEIVKGMPSADHWMGYIKIATHEEWEALPPSR